MSKDRIYTILSRKLTGEATPAELAELDDVIKSYPDSHLPAQIIEEFWQAPSEQDADFLEATYYLHLKRLKQKEREENLGEIEEASFVKPTIALDKRSNKLVLSSVFIAFASLIFFPFFLHQKKIINNQEVKNPESVVATKQGSRTKILLPDGTSVWLNGNSKLIYNNQHYGETLREVTLTGEAYFDVVKNAAKPFVIYTIAMNIKVLGTAFNVKSYASEKTSETSLIRGSIEVTLINKANRKIMLKPNEKITVSNIKEAKAITASISSQPQKQIPDSFKDVAVAPLKFDAKEKTFKEIAWKENKLMFKNESLESIAVMLERWFGQPVEIRDEKLKQLQFTGNFHDENILQVLQALQASYNFNFTTENKTIIIYQ